ncbi:MAG: pyruvate dehydrogenase E1 component [Acidimicrobiales bacterium]
MNNPNRASSPNTPTGAANVDLDVLRNVEKRVLWLATRIIDEANRREGGEIKVGGHQASCASMVSIMTALWFAHIGGEDKVAVKPHASPVYHAIKYLTGELDRSYLTTLRQQGGLQAYPSRTKDPDVSDFSTGSVGLGAVAPLFSALTRRYGDAHFGEHPPARFVATVGDAELDEGNVWEAISDPATQGLSNFTMVVDLNRQSLDRVIPDIHAIRLQRFFADAGWHVAEAKFGSRLTAAFQQPGGEALRQRIDDMSNEAYQSMFALDGPALRNKFLDGADSSVRKVAADLNDQALKELVTDLGGHDLGLLIDTFRSCDLATDRPSVVFAYTIKGWGLPIAGDPLNHAALLTDGQIDTARTAAGLDVDREWDAFAPGSAESELCLSVGGDINNLPPAPRPRLVIPSSAAPLTRQGFMSTQEAFGRTLTRLADFPEIVERMVTTSPDVSISTNLGGWINRFGVFSPTERDDHGGGDRLLKWAPSPTGQHIELGISEMNLFMLLSQLGLSHEHHAHHLLPIGTVYDPFVLRGLDALVYALYNGSRFVLAGTPSGVTLAPEGGAHQSTITPSVGIELPGLHYAEPAYASEVDWLLCDGLDQLGLPEGESTYLRLSTRPIDQAPFAAAVERLGEDELRRQVLAGGYRLSEPTLKATSVPGPTDRVTIVTTGAMAPEALVAQATLADEGVDAVVVHLTSPDRTYRSWQRSDTAAIEAATHRHQLSHIHQLVPAEERRNAVVSVQDGASHSLAWIGSALATRQIALGVDRFGESGTIDDLHRLTGISADHIVNAALATVAQ